MKKISRRQLFRGAGAAVVGGAALAVGLKPTKAAPIGIGACSRVGKSLPVYYPEWSPTLSLPLDCPLWQKRFLDSRLKEAGFSGGARYKTQ